MAWSPLALKGVSPTRRVAQRLGVGLALLIHLFLLTALQARAAERPATERPATLVGHVQSGGGGNAAGLKVIVMPVGQIAEHRYTPAAVTKTLMDDYSALVRAKPAKAA